MQFGIVTVEDNRVGPLYKHVFPPCLAPWISFVGLPNKVIAFLTAELQSKWIAQVLSGKVLLPEEEEMMASVEEFYQRMEEMGRPKHYTHMLDMDAFEYKNWVAAQVGLPPVEEWMKQMYSAAVKNIRSHQEGFRDEWDDDYWKSIIRNQPN
ncbi:PREDICTED: flavin-containing monooxygenase FMO GS-OX-like 5 [Nelumbo nucifera]|uniref:Flavin-containing monooxygenase n=1 Tax=Nelumbo nucifera TaxID=4432 RepID=A0A1U8AAC5_NELNU|nr:PREDICTED: flavin-containing monooxygenase FMO GS-OX-like 5 [Nelumbo nucifera]